MTDLFVLSPEALLRQKVLAKERDRLRIRGHAAPPGTGPAGETCKTCQHYAHVQHASSYRKCGLMRARWTGGPGTDIRAGDPACSKWERVGLAERLT